MLKYMMQVRQGLRLGKQPEPIHTEKFLVLQGLHFFYKILHEFFIICLFAFGGF